jgi:hypothetical protein
MQAVRSWIFGVGSVQNKELQQEYPWLLAGKEPARG